MTRAASFTWPLRYCFYRSSGCGGTCGEIESIFDRLKFKQGTAKDRDSRIAAFAFCEGKAFATQKTE